MSETVHPEELKEESPELVRARARNDLIISEDLAKKAAKELQEAAQDEFTEMSTYAGLKGEIMKLDYQIRYLTLEIERKTERFLELSKNEASLGMKDEQERDRLQELVPQLIEKKQSLSTKLNGLIISVETEKQRLLRNKELRRIAEPFFEREAALKNEYEAKASTIFYNHEALPPKA